MQKILIVIVGPTAVGKTSLSISLAQKFATQIISCDSRQIYREMNIGTAKPTLQEMQAVPHHLLGSVSIHTPFSVADFANEATRKIEEIFIANDKAIMVGGSGLYINAVCNGLDELPGSNPEIKNKLTQIFEQEGIEKLQQQLQQLDPEFYETIDLANSHRLIRAIEVCLISGKKFSELRSGKKAHHNFKIIKIGVDIERPQLYDRINKRVEIMMQNGLLDEAKELFPHSSLKALNTVGYKELFDYFKNKISLAEAVKLIQQNSRNYAKRQLTWFRKDKEINWFSWDDESGIENFIRSIAN